MDYRKKGGRSRGLSIQAGYSELSPTSWQNPLTCFPEKDISTLKIKFNKSSQTSILSSLKTKKQSNKLPKVSKTLEARRRINQRQDKRKGKNFRKKGPFILLFL